MLTANWNKGQIDFNSPIEELGLSTSSEVRFKKADILTAGALISKSPMELERLPLIGRKHLLEVAQKLAELKRDGLLAKPLN